jgi:hypothetical protein
LGWSRCWGSRPPSSSASSDRSPPASQVRRAGRTSVAKRSTWSRPAPGQPQ